MISIIEGQAAERSVLADSMFELRYAVFIERLRWRLDCPPGREIDQFDHDGAVYLVVANPRGQAVASCRLLPTTGPHLLRDLFPYLVKDGTPPVDRKIWEASRLAVDHRADRLAGAGNACGILLCGIMEYALSIGLRHLVSVSDARVERILKRTGWNPVRLGAPHEMDGVKVMAERADISELALARVRRLCGVFHSVLPASADLRRVA